MPSEHRRINQLGTHESRCHVLLQMIEPCQRRWTTGFSYKRFQTRGKKNGYNSDCGIMATTPCSHIVSYKYFAGMYYHHYWGRSHQARSFRPLLLTNTMSQALTPKLKYSLTWRPQFPGNYLCCRLEKVKWRNQYTFTKIMFKNYHPTPGGLSFNSRTLKQENSPCRAFR
jgi:hypothetical protein